MRALLRRLRRHWAVRSTGVGIVSTAIDAAALFLLVRSFALPTPLASAIAVALGCVVSFFLNKYLAFKETESPLLPQATRYLLTTAIAMAVHAGLMHTLVDRWGVHLLLAKLASDVLVFACGNMCAMRLLVFPARMREAVAEASPQPALPPSRHPVGTHAHALAPHRERRSRGHARSQTLPPHGRWVVS